MKAMETSAIFLGSLLLHAVIGFIIVMCYWEVAVEPDQTYAVTVWRDAKGKDVLRIGAPEEGPVTKGPEVAPEPPKKEEPPTPKVEEPRPAPAEPAPRLRRHPRRS
jgi:outer membrane biosynthesis protein TonB